MKKSVYQLMLSLKVYYQHRILNSELTTEQKDMSLKWLREDFTSIDNLIATIEYITLKFDI